MTITNIIPFSKELVKSLDEIGYHTVSFPVFLKNKNFTSLNRDINNYSKNILTGSIVAVGEHDGGTWIIYDHSNNFLSSDEFKGSDIIYQNPSMIIPTLGSYKISQEFFKELCAKVDGKQIFRVEYSKHPYTLSKTHGNFRNTQINPELSSFIGGLDLIDNVPFDYSDNNNIGMSPFPFKHEKSPIARLLGMNFIGGLSLFNHDSSKEGYLFCISNSDDVLDYKGILSGLNNSGINLQSARNLTDSYILFTRQASFEFFKDNIPKVEHDKLEIILDKIYEK